MRPRSVAAPRGKSAKPDRVLHSLVAVLLLGVFFAQAMSSIPRLSITFDEDLHITTGYGTLRTGDLRLIKDHPPLIGLWMTWPLLLSPQIPEPQDVPAWELGDRPLFARNEAWWSVPLDLWVVPPRILVSWLALLLGAFLFRWTTDWFGPRAGLFALALLVFDPNILANATVATLDLGVASLIFIAMYVFQRSLHRPQTSTWIVAGIMLGLAVTAKISALILLPVAGGLMTLWGLKHWPKRRLVTYSAIYLGVAFLTLWAVHCFEFGPPRGLSFSVPAPTYWRSFMRVGEHVSVGNRTYLLGETYYGGRWYYFPVVFGLKTPLPTLILLGVAVAVAWRRPRRWWRELVLASLPVTYFSISLLNEINLGYRHLLPVLPFLYLFVARLAGPVLEPGGPAGRGIPRGRSLLLALVLLWQAVGTLRIWPHYLTFANEIAGGARNGYRYMADSNVDWGQGLKALRDYLEERPWIDPKLSSFTYFIRPELYGIEATPLPPLADAAPVLPARLSPAPGTYVISASTLRGLKLVDPETYNWFWHREPDDVVANGLLVYHVHDRVPDPTWLGQCSVPVTPLSSDAVVEGFGRSDLRSLAFDCTQSWLYPDAGESAGWYVLHREAASKEGDFIPRRLGEAGISFEQKVPQATPPLTVFEWNPLAVTPAQEGETLWAAPAEWSPAQALAEGVPVVTPVHLDGPLTFAGYILAQEGQDVTVDAYWLVRERPERPFSLMAHVVDAEGHPVAVGDGLGIPWHQMQSGDLLVQRHVLEIPAKAASGTCWLQVGAYTLPDVQRMPILQGDVVVGDRLLVGEVRVTAP